jgi:hypothetical protein
LVSTRRHFDHFLDEGQYIQIVVQEDQLSLILINHVGQLELALPILVSYPRSFAFWKGGLGLVFDTQI